MKKVVKISLLLLLAASFVGTIYFLYQKSQKKPLEYKVESPFETDIIKKTVATGSVVPRRKVDVKSRVSGIIDKIYVIAGQKINAGDVIARVKIIPDMVNLSNAENRVNRARIAFNKSKIDFERTKDLYGNKVVPLSDYQDSELAYNNNREELNAAEDNLQLTKKGSSRSMGNETNTIIKATISGMILNVPVKEGNSVIESNTFNEGTTIVSIADMDDMIFEGFVDESEVGKIKAGMELIITIGAIEKEKYNAKLEYISPQGETKEGAIQFGIKAAVSGNTKNFIRAGYSANADIVLERKDKVLAVKESVLTVSKDSTYVEVEKGIQIYEKRLVKTGLSDGINIQILSGITKSEKLKGALIDTNAPKNENGG